MVKDAAVFVKGNDKQGFLPFGAIAYGVVNGVERNLADNRDGLKAEYFNAAAVVSTKLLPGEPNDRLLVGVPYRGADGRKMAPGPEQRFRVSELPEDWPASWQPGMFQYPEVYPTIPMRKDCPPDQINLDRILNFVLV